MRASFRTRAIGAITIALTLLLSAGAEARLTRLQINTVEVLVVGAPFGDAGPYDRLTGTAYFEADPFEPHNAQVFAIDKAPRNARGMVEFSADAVILKPVDMHKANGALFSGPSRRRTRKMPQMSSVRPTREKADNSAGPQRPLFSDRLPVCGFHPGPEPTLAPTSEAVDTCAVVTPAHHHRARDSKMEDHYAIRS